MFGKGCAFDELLIKFKNPIWQMLLLYHNSTHFNLYLCVFVFSNLSFQCIFLCSDPGCQSGVLMMRCSFNKANLGALNLCSISHTIDVVFSFVSKCICIL